MRYEPANSVSNAEHARSYHCNFEGCPVRYDLDTGYYTVVAVSQRTYRLEEPGVNTLQCPKNHGWLYRQEDPASDTGTMWRCGAEGCDYCFNAPTKGDWVRT